jgi:lipopolysaccharide export system permease protein
MNTRSSVHHVRWIGNLSTMPWTLYRYILRELIKLMALSVAILVTMISFAAAIKPMSDGLLGPGAMLKFVGYSAPTMLGFALPFAGAFASTLVFIRMAADNEVLACSASGLSYARILAPIAALGLVLTMGLFYLSNFVMPGFYRAASETLEDDLMSVMVTQLNQNRPFTEMDGYVLYADSAVQMPAPPETGATKFIQLAGVAVGELDEQDRVRADSTAKIANILLFQDDKGSRVTMKLLEAMRYLPNMGDLKYHRSWEIGPVALPSPFRDDTKFMSWPQLRELEREPERFKDVREAKAELAREVAVAELRTSIREHLKADRGEGAVVLKGSRQTYMIKSPAVRTVSGVLVLNAKKGRSITIEYPADAPQRRIEAASAHIKIRPGDPGVQPTASIQLGEVRVFKVPGSEPITEKITDTLPPMVWIRDVIDNDIEQKPLGVLQSAASPHLGRSANVLNAKEGLDTNIVKLGRKITSQLHERAASAMTCLMLLVFGSVLAMHLKGQMPLVVFFWSFLLAIVSIIIIHTGQNLAATTGRVTVPVGLAVLWAGNVGMALAILVVYRRLAKN